MASYRTAARGRRSVIVVSDPTDLPMIDEIGVVLNTPIKVTVGAPSCHPFDSQEERKLTAGARGGDGGVSAEKSSKRMNQETKASPSTS
jgi:hypothetical protein